MKAAFSKDDELLAAIDAAPRDPAVFSYWWLGQSGFLVVWNGRRLLFDPYLSDSLTVKYASTDKPHVRVTERVVEPGSLRVDVVTSSHNHTDHLDGETLGPLRAANEALEIVVPRANVAFAADRLGVPSNRLTPAVVDERVDAAEFSLTAVPAAHEQLEVDENGDHRFVGFIARFGDHSVYHSGDTVRFDGLSERLAGEHVDVTFLPINGRAPERRVAGNLWGREAAELARDIGAGCVVPCHYDMFEFNTATTDEFEETCRRLGQKHRVLRCGEGAVFAR